MPMKSMIWVLVCSLSMLLTTQVYVQAQDGQKKQQKENAKNQRPPKDRKGRRGGMSPMIFMGGGMDWQKMLEKYDTNKNGRIDREERDAIRQDILNKYDKNGDGELDEEERKLQYRDRLSEEFAELDLDKDGKVTLQEYIDAKEKRREQMRQRIEAMRAQWRKRFEQRKKELEKKSDLRKRFDTNGDGKVDEQEARAAAEKVVEQFKERGAVGPLKKFDKNGDGQLDEDEAKAAVETMVQRLMKGKEEKKKGRKGEEHDGDVPPPPPAAL
ncbi:MAG: hypothetical protein D6820_15950 [Lentisphaerae bacterium]|nr:MAG: hypothetical protein D6820_15950 [Lentisphaerota bacterium]